jgi:hypothetical protein
MRRVPMVLMSLRTDSNIKFSGSSVRTLRREFWHLVLPLKRKAIPSSKVSLRSSLFASRLLA